MGSGCGRATGPALVGDAARCPDRAADPAADAGLSDLPASDRQFDQEPRPGSEPPSPTAPTPLSPGVEPIQPITGNVITGAPQNPQAPLPASAAPPFGSQLFLGQPQLFGPVAINRNYIVSPGDQIDIQVWGAFAYNGVQGVDPQGNIFIPQVGPIHVAGVTANNLIGAATAAVRHVFTENVFVYASLLSKQPVAVYVTGAVKAPGRFSGDRLNSPLQFILQAGGINPKAGSFRDLRITRAGKLLAQIDLYAFLTGLDLPSPNFQDNDTIFVGFQHPTVTAEGDVQNNYAFELDPQSATGGDVIALARPNPTVSYVSIQGLRNDRPYNAYMKLADFRTMKIASGDIYNFRSDYVSDTIFVNVNGQSDGPSSFIVQRGARVGEVLKMIQIDPAIADLPAIYLRRKSVALQQQQALDQQLGQLQRSVLTKTSLTQTDAALNTQEAQLVEAFIQQARSYKPEGRLVLATAVDRDAVMLEPEDEIVIPAKTDVVLVTGEVRLPQSVVFTPDRKLTSYTKMAGGYTDRADRSTFVVLHASGEIETGGDSVTIRSGDQIMVMPRVDSHDIAVISDIATIIYEVAVSTGVTLRLTQ